MRDEQLTVQLAALRPRSSCDARAGARAAAAAFVLGAHAAPALTSVPWLRRRFLPVLSGRGDLAHLALTFDDGPDPISTPAFLQALDGLGWRATFFMLGSMVARAPRLAAEVASAGHEVALHGYHHRSHLLRTPAVVSDDTARALDMLAEATGTPPGWMRPPYGAVSAGSLLAARRHGLRLVLWTDWGRDWRAEATPASVTFDLTRRLAPGGTVLLHDSDCTSAPGCWRSALGALPLLADRLGGTAVGPLGEHGVGEHGVGEHGVGEHGVGEHGVGGHGVGGHGVGGHRRRPGSGPTRAPLRR